MASPSAPPCPHELRPGTAVCLRCQHAERGVKRAKQRQMFARGGAAFLSIAVIAAVGIAAVTALRARGGTKASTPDKGAASTPTPPDTGIIAADSAPPTAAPPIGTPPTTDVTAKGSVDASTSSMSVASAAVVAPSAPPATAGAPMSTASAGSVPLMVPVGRTSLRDTMVAERAGDTVRVSFDLLLSRTRRPDKFEAIVRSTLPQIYGAAADSALRALPQGAVARAGDLITTLPERGFHIPVAGGRTIAVWPETRAGRDGPLVVAYRAVVSR